jgi:hypothetical protein
VLGVRPCVLWLIRGIKTRLECMLTDAEGEGDADRGAAGVCTHSPAYSCAQNEI